MSAAEDAKILRKLSNLQTKLNLQEQTVRLEEEERLGEKEELREKKEKEGKRKEAQAAAAAQIQYESMLQKEEAEKQRLLDDVMKDPTVPRSVVLLMKAQSGKNTTDFM